MQSSLILTLPSSLPSSMKCSAYLSSAQLKNPYIVEFTGKFIQNCCELSCFIFVNLLSACFVSFCPTPTTPSACRARIRSGAFGQNTRRGLQPEFTLPISPFGRESGVCRKSCTYPPTKRTNKKGFEQPFGCLILPPLRTKSAK